jgi:Domain of unknown function (DUF4412)
MKRLLPSLLLLLAAAPLGVAGLVLTQEIEQSAGPAPGKTTMTMTVSGDKARADIGKDMSTIVDSGSGAITSLVHAQKMAMELPEGTFDSIKKTAEEKKQKSKPDLKPTGKKQTINGFECEEYVGMVEGMDVTFWVTKDVKNQKEILDQLGKLSGGGNPFEGALKSGEDFPGIPIRTVIKTPQAGTATMTVVSIKDMDVPDSTFQIPSGYKIMSLPKSQAPGAGAPPMPANPAGR